MLRDKFVKIRNCSCDQTVPDSHILWIILLFERCPHCNKYLIIFNYSISYPCNILLRKTKPRESARVLKRVINCCGKYLNRLQICHGETLDKWPSDILTKDNWMWRQMSNIPLIRSNDLSLMTAKNQLLLVVGGQHSTEVAFALLTQPARGQLSAFPKIFLTEISIDVAEFHRWQSLLSIKWTVESLIALIGPI